MASIDLSFPHKVRLNNQNTTLNSGATLSGDRLYKRTGSLQSSPQVGDLRMQYSVLPNGVTVSVLGKLDSNNQITPYIHESNAQLYRIFPGTRQQALATLKTEHTFLTWVLRLIGFLMMWIGVTLTLEPISVVLDSFTFLGFMSRGITQASAFFVAFVLSSVTILISMLLHNIVALGLAVMVAVGVLLTLRKLKSSML